MAFILKYLDEALDTVTGRYDEVEEESQSEENVTTNAVRRGTGEGKQAAGASAGTDRVMSAMLCVRWTVAHRKLST